MRFSTVALGVADPEVAARFYTEGLGLTVHSRPLPDLVYLSSGPTRIALYPADRLARYAGTEPRAAGGVVLSMDFDTSDAVDRAFEKSCAAGGTALRTPTRMDWGGWAGVVRDPDGHVVELACAPGDQSTAKS
jgi:catechol 2,3-dioxygenase-like lactoylglutathione lyase family enzyme